MAKDITNALFDSGITKLLINAAKQVLTKKMLKLKS